MNKYSLLSLDAFVQDVLYISLLLPLAKEHLNIVLSNSLIYVAFILLFCVIHTVFCSGGFLKEIVVISKIRHLYNFRILLIPFRII